MVILLFAAVAHTMQMIFMIESKKADCPQSAPQLWMHCTWSNRNLSFTSLWATALLSYIAMLRYFAMSKKLLLLYWDTLLCQENNYHVEILCYVQFVMLRYFDMWRYFAIFNLLCLRYFAMFIYFIIVLHEFSIIASSSHHIAAIKSANIAM